MTLTTTTLVTASAQMVQITTLARGDVYKRLNTSGYGGPELRIGVVTDVMHNGTDAAITALEWIADGREPKATSKVFATGETPSIFAATPEEAVAMFADVATTADQRVDSARKALAEAEGVSHMVEQVRIGLPALTAAAIAPATVAASIPATANEDTF